VAADRCCNLQLGANAVGAGDQQRIAVARLGEIENPAEPADRGVGPGSRGRARQRLDRFD
jgi:hypothetical protein